MSNTTSDDSLITTEVQADSNDDRTTPATGTAVAARNLDVYYGDEQAIDDVTMEIPEKRVTALIGPSGCGKSTFLRCINRMNDMIEICRVEGDVEFGAARSGWCSRNRTRSRSRSATTSRTG